MHFFILPKTLNYSHLFSPHSGRVLKELGLRRTDIIVTTKLYWGAERKGPNDQGLSRKQ